jgi:signal transduction histidine kinase/Tfp pilus assembly protein PilF
MVRTIQILIILFSFTASVFAQNRTIDSLENLIQNHISNDTARINLLNKAALKYSNVNLAKTLQYAIEADSLSEILNYNKGKAESMRMTGLYYRIKADYTKSLEYFNKSIAIADLVDDKNGIADALNNIGTIYYSQGENEIAIEYYKKSLKIAEETGNKVQISNFYNNIGIIYRHQGNYPKALENYQNSLRIDEEVGNKAGLANSYNNIGIIYRHQGDYPKAIEYYQKSVEIKEEIGDKRGLSLSYNNIGITYHFLGDYNKALDYLNKSIEIRKEIGDKKGLSVCNNTIGTIYSAMGNYREAMKYFDTGLKYSIEIGSKSTQANIYTGMGEAYLKQNKIKEANQYSIKAYKLGNELNDLDIIKSSSELLYKTYAEIGMYKEAYNYLHIFKTMSDSILNEENTRKIVGLEYEYKYEKEKELVRLNQEKQEAVYQEELKRQKSIRNSFILGFVMVILILAFLTYSFYQKRKTNRLLGTKNLEIEDKNKELTILNSDKDRFMQILAHDLLGPISSTLGLSDVLLEDIHSQDKNSIEQVLRTINKSQHNTIDLLNDLLLWSKSHSGKLPFEPTKFSFHEICIDIITEKQNQAAQKNIILNFTAEENLFLFADINMVKTILRNLISNAIKFTNKNGNVTIYIERNNQNSIVTVSDSGVGISSEDKNKLWNFSNPYTTPGTNKERGTGLGLLICKEFVEKHGGKIWVESEPEKGSDFKFSIPAIS